MKKLYGSGFCFVRGRWGRRRHDSGKLIPFYVPRRFPSPSTKKPSLAVMYFKNNTGSAGLDHWRTMLANLLVTDLTQSKHIRVLSEDKLFQILSRLGQGTARRTRRMSSARWPQKEESTISFRGPMRPKDESGLTSRSRRPALASYRVGVGGRERGGEHLRHGG